jgi:3-phosphoshikimate 1-carboxyvinyltransferase
VAAEIHTYDDHRVAMAFSILGLVHSGVTIEDPGCVAKSFPGFWAELERFTRHHNG